MSSSTGRTVRPILECHVFRRCVRRLHAPSPFGPGSKSPWGTSRQTGETLFHSGPVRPAAPLAACHRTLARNGAEIVAVIPGRLGGLPHAFFGNGFACQCSAVFSFHCSPRRLISVS